MAFDPSGFTTDFIIRVGSATLYALLGGFIVSVKPRRRANVAAGLAILLFGVGLLASNVGAYLFGGNERATLANTGSAGAIFVVVAVVILWMAALWSRPVPPRRVVAPAVLLGVLGATVVGLFSMPDTFPGLTGEAHVASFLFNVAATGLVPLACATLSVALAERWAAGETQGLAFAAPMVALVVTTCGDAGGALSVVATERPDVVPASLLAAFAVMATLVLVGCLWLLRAAMSPRRRLALALSTGLLGVMLLALLLGDGVRPAWVPTAASRALPGLLRLLGAALLANAIFRHGALAVPLPSLRARFAGVATVFLVVLFAFAQILQDAIGGGTGLLVGGVVAMMSVVAGPKVEGLVGRGFKRGKAEAAYRDALRIALRDRQLAPDEERALMVLADHLGIGAARAYELRDEVRAG